MYVKKKDLGPDDGGIGYTAGCPGCKALIKGTAATGHSGDCRRRVKEKISKSTSGDARVKAARAREDEYLAKKLEANVKKSGRESVAEAEDTWRFRIGVQPQPQKQEGGSSSSTSAPPPAASRKRGAEDDGDQDDAMTPSSTLPLKEKVDRR